MIHVRDVGLKQASDEPIWKWAKSNSYTTVTTDADFIVLIDSRGCPPKVIHLKNVIIPLRIIEELLRQNAVQISEFDNDSHSSLLALRSRAD